MTLFYFFYSKENLFPIKLNTTRQFIFKPSKWDIFPCPASCTGRWCTWVCPTRCPRSSWSGWRTPSEWTAALRWCRATCCRWCCFSPPSPSWCTPTWNVPSLFTKVVTILLYQLFKRIAIIKKSCFWNHYYLAQCLRILWKNSSI